METKTKQPSASADASAAKETKKRTTAKKKTSEVVAPQESLEKKKTSASRRSTDKTAEKKSSASKKNASEKTPEVNAAESPASEEKKTKASVPAIDPAMPVEEKKKPEKALKKSVENKSPKKTKADPQKEKKNAEKSAEEMPTEKKASSVKKKAESKVEETVVLEQLSVEIADLAPEKKRKPARSSRKKSEKPVSVEDGKTVSKDEVESKKTENETSTVTDNGSVREEIQKDSVDSSIEEKLAKMAKNAISAPLSVFSEQDTEKSVDVSGTPRETFVFYSPSQLAAMEREKEREGEASKATEESAVTENTSSVEPVAAEAANSESVSEIKRERVNRRGASSRKNDSHEREVMDKDFARATIYKVLERIQNPERRALIEEVMKLIPLTDEERADNHPTSLFNRVRSVVGSMLAEELAQKRIVSDGRRLSLPSVTEEASSNERAELLDIDSIEEKEDTSKRTAALELELDMHEEKSEIEANVSDTVEPLPEMQTEEAEATTEDVPVDPAPTVMPVREASIRKTRQQRGERRISSQPTGGILLVTEEELERVIINALRRTSLTKNDLLTVLKRTYVDTYNLSKEEEGRIYTVAGNLLQKLVNRGTLQNNDGRYLQKPSQRVLNPGRVPGASFTGNVEARFITELNRQSGDFFEQFAARLLEKYFEMSNIRVDASYVVGGSDDNGIDIMLETTDWLGYKERVFVQAKKRATQPVTLKEVREFYGALSAEEGTRGVFITTSSFCMEASKMIGKLRNLIAIDKRKLFLLAEHCEVGLVRDEEGRLLLDENLFLDYEV